VIATVILVAEVGAVAAHSTLALCSDIEACFLRGGGLDEIEITLTASGSTMLSNCAAVND